MGSQGEVVGGGKGKAESGMQARQLRQGDGTWAHMCQDHGLCQYCRAPILQTNYLDPVLLCMFSGHSATTGCGLVCASEMLQASPTLTKLLIMLVGLCLPPPAAPCCCCCCNCSCCCCCCCCCAAAVGPSVALFGSESSEPVTTLGQSAKMCTVPLSLLTASQSQCWLKAMLCMCADSVPRRSSCATGTQMHSVREAHVFRVQTADPMDNTNPMCCGLSCKCALPASEVLLLS
jgi:hypothetical protein